MAHSIALIRDLTPLKTNWSTYVRLVHCYHMPARRNPDIILAIECLFEDNEGDIIHATIDGTAMQNIRMSPIEGYIYAVRDFLVVHDTSPYKTSTNRNKILFTENTKMLELIPADPVSHIRQDLRYTQPAIVKSVDALKSWLDVACIQCMQWFDISGHFIACTKCRPKSPSVLFRAKLGIILTDEHGTKRLTFWENECVKLIGY